MVYCRYTYAAPLVSDSFTPLVPFFRFVYRTIFQGELRVKKQGSAAGGKANENEEWRMKNEESAAGGKANENEEWKMKNEESAAGGKANYTI